jgi:hypothetical protein
MKSLVFQVMLLLAMSLFVNFASECFAIDDNIVLWLQFDEGSGTVVKDSSNYKNDGTITGAKWVEGKKGSALSFDGISNFVEIPSTDSLQLSDKGITIAVWFKTTETARQDLMFIEKGAWDNGEYALSYPGYANFKVRFQLYEIYGKLTNQIDSTTGVPTLSDDKWHHAAGVYDAVNHIFRVYVDGKMETQQDANPHKFTPDNQSVFLGTRNRSGNWYVGAIDDLLVAKVPFTDDEIKKHINGTLKAVAHADKLATEWGNVKKYGTSD